jgi:hypothetical protein
LSIKLLCSEPGCSKKVLARTVCAMHYARQSKSGTLPARILDGEGYLERARKRLLSFVKEDADGCWIWQGSKSGTSPYGMFYLRPKLSTAHRAAYILFCGDPGEKQVCHKCDKPLCVRPGCLFAGTQLENEADKRSKNRQSQGEHRTLAKLTDAKVLEIRKSDLSYGQLGKLYGVAATTVRSASIGKTWSHLK